MLAKLCHEALAETHNFSVALALRIEVRAALAAAHRQSCKAVLEYLLKAQELDDPKVNRGVESDTALVGSDSRVELYSEATVYLNLTVVVYPRNTEHDLTLRLNDTLENACIDEVLSLLSNRLKSLKDFSNGLDELRLAGISLLNCF